VTNVDVISPHPANELLAEYADGKLAGRKAEEVFVHLDACDDCRAIWDAIADAKDEGVIERADAPVVVHGNFGRKVAIGTVAAAAAAAAIFFTPPVQDRLEFRRTGGVSALIEATNQMPQRETQGRLAGFEYKPPKSIKRGENDENDVPLDLYQAAGDIEKRLDDTPSAQQLRALGLSYLLTGQKDTGIEMLARAHAAAPNDPVVMNDLAAAYLHTGDAAKALELAEKARRREPSPEAAWNRALALEYLQRDVEARAAWEEYLRLDPKSEWANEVRKDHLYELP